MKRDYSIKISNTQEQWRLLLVFYLLLLQSPLQQIHSVFDYLDEVFALLGITYMAYCGLVTGILRVKKTTARMAFAVFVFLSCGFLGNILFEYQSVKYVLIDIFTNLKFFLCIISGYVLFRNSTKETEAVLNKHARICAVCYFVMLILDQLFQVFPSPEMRYGMRVSVLTHTHATYLAGSMVFLLSIMTVFYEKRNRRYIVMTLVVLFFTLRGKAIAGAATYIILVYFTLNRKRKIKLWHIAVMVVLAIAIAWDQISFYYLELEGRSARSVLTQTAFQIMKDYFPIGTGFGTYASAVAGENYSRVYEIYGFLGVYELGGNETGWGFYSDTFWPIIMGQTGVIGLIAYVVLLAMLLSRILKIRKYDIYAYTTGIFIFAYLMISSTSEPAFNNSVAVPIAAVLGYIFSLENQSGRKEIVSVES